MSAYINRNGFDDSVRNNGRDAREGRGGGMGPLPLHILAMIVNYVCARFLSLGLELKYPQLDEAGDLARTCRTCRVLHYMTLPQLYTKISLHSYSYIRYSKTQGRPEGHGGASPFSMALNTLVTRNVVGYVKSFRLWGSWKEHDLEECAAVGRVPDDSMLLNCLVRAIIDRMPVLESFR